MMTKGEGGQKIDDVFYERPLCSKGRANKKGKFSEHGIRPAIGKEIRKVNFKTANISLHKL